MIRLLLLLLLLPLLTTAQTHWDTDSPTPLTPANSVARQTLAVPATTGRLTVTAGAQGGQVAYFIHNVRPGNPFLGYREATDSVTVFVDPTADSIVIGCLLKSGERAEVSPPVIRFTPAPTATPVPVVVEFIREVLGYASRHALDRDSIDWSGLERDALALAADASSPEASHEVVDFTLRRVDRHSFLQPPTDYKNWQTGNNDNDDIDPNLQYPQGRRVEDRMVYLWVPSLSSGHEKTLNAYADSLQRLIAELDSPTTDRWIVDLRGNEGGNCWPMLSGLGPLIGEGTCGYFMRRDGSEAQAWTYADGTTRLNGISTHSLTASPYRLKHPAPKITVLTGPATASSAEVIAVAFHGMPNARSFGLPTAGFSTGNQLYRLSDGSAMLLTVSVYGDREKTAFGGTIAPDVRVESAPGMDAASEAAATWLRAQD